MNKKLFLLSFLLIFSACSSPTEGFLEYNSLFDEDEFVRNIEFGFSVKYPPEWETYWRFEKPFLYFVIAPNFTSSFTGQDFSGPYVLILPFEITYKEFDGTPREFLIEWSSMSQEFIQKSGHRLGSIGIGA